MIYFVIYIVLLGLAVIYNHAQIELMGYPRSSMDRKEYQKHQDRWHITQGAAMIIVVMFFEYTRVENFKDLMIHSALILIIGSVLYDAGLNKLRKKDIFYVGKTAPTDRFIRWAAKKTKNEEEDTAGVIKIIVLAIAILLKVWL